MVTATLGADIRLATRDIPPDAFNDLAARLQVTNPKWLQAIKRGGHTWGIAQHLFGLTLDGDAVRILRGAGSILRQVLKEHGESLTVTDERTAPGGLSAPLMGAVLRDYQCMATEAIRTRQQGVIVLGTGGGKTVTGVASVAAVGQPALVVAHTRDLVDQWRDTFSRLLGIETGLVGDGKTDWRQVTCATFQSLTALHPVELEERAKAFGYLLVDECHHASAETFARVISAFPAKWRIGFTATPDRDDGLGPLVGWTFGPRLIEMGTAELIAAGYLASPRIVQVPTAFDFEYGGPEDWQKLLTALVQDEARNALVCDLVAREAMGGGRVLVLSGRVEHCGLLAAGINAAGVEAAVVTAQNCTPKQRRALIASFRAGELPVMVASTLADEGLDVPCVDRAVLAFPSKSPTAVAQRLGRILRLSEGKGQPVLFDIVDNVGPLRSQAAKRRKTFAEVLGLSLPGWSRGQSRANAARAA